MSAFAGFVSLGGPGVPPGTEERLRQGLVGAGLGRVAVRRFDRGVFVFRQRIVTPEDHTERQPSVGAEGRLLSMFDGRLDNRGDLLAALGLHGASATRMPDGEIVRTAYERWGEEAVPRLLGDFAWAVWNGRDGRLLLARDHDINRSLFYGLGDGFVAFATGYRPLLALPDLAREVDELAVADLLLTCPDDSDRSFYKGIAWVGAAERVVVGEAGVRRDRVWEPAPRPPLRLPRDGDYVEAARAVFDEAVACRLRTAGSVVASVSGGLDSSAIAATAARLRAPAMVHGLCVVPQRDAVVWSDSYRYADERPFVASLAASCANLEVEYLETTTAQPFELDPQGLFLDAGMPLRGPSNSGWFRPMYLRAAELGATTLLQGDFGNFTVSLNGFERLAALRDGGRWLTLAWEFAALRRTLPASRWHHLVRQQVAAVLPRRLREGVRRMRGKQPPPFQGMLLNPDFIRSASLVERHERHGVTAQDFATADGIMVVLRYALQRSRMQVEGRAALRTACGLVPSTPLADRRLIDFCLSLPSEQFLHGGVWRRLARRAFADRLPPDITGNLRRGAQNADWHQRLTPHRAALAAELERLEAVPLAGKLLDLPGMKEILASWPDDPAAVGGDGRLYRTKFFRALHVGQFLGWLDGGNRPP